MNAVLKDDVIDLTVTSAAVGLSARHDFESQIVSRAITDEVFRAELIADPRATLEREIANVLGKQVSLPDDFTVSVIEETENSACIVLPVKRTVLNRNLGPTNAELDPNGGVAYYCTTIGCKPGFSC